MVDTTTRAVVATTHKRGFCLRDSFCDTGSATYGCGFQGISAGCGDTYRRTLGCQFVEITGVPSGDYELQVTVDPFDLFPELDETNNLSSVPVTISRGGPPGTAIPLPPLGGVVAGVTSGASAYSGSCASGATTNSPDALFSLTATTSGTYTVQTCSQNTLYDTVMYVREGALDGAEIGCDDDTIGCGVNDGSGNAARHGSSVPINATAGETYYIFVDGYNAGGPFELTVTRPDGGLCGDDTADGPEECDGTDDAACPGLCLADCNCAPPPSVCGDDIMEGSEACDGTDDTACPGLCLADCNCSVCGDDVSEGTEACDGADDAACPGLCQSDCTCPPPGPVCGDDTQEGLEECDGSDDLACPGLCLPDCNCIPPTAINTMLVPFKDNTLYESISGDLSNGEGDYLFVGLTGDSSRRRALMAFDVARDIPAGSIIHAATLTLHMSRTVGQTRDVSLHRLNSDWNEGSSHAGGEEGGGALATDGDATWLYTHYDSISPGTSPAWSTPGGDFATTASATTPVAGEGFYSWSSVVLAADAQAWLDNPASNFGWIAIGDEQTLATAKRFDSGENGNTASWPTLEVHFSPPSPNWGACCATDGSCGFSLDGADCSTQGGVYQGDATICSPNPCPQPTGACCMLDRSCGEVTQTQCAQAGGSFTGHLTTCAATECPVLDLQPYVDPLPIPAVAQPLSGAVGGEAHYEIAMTEFTQQLHSDLPPTTVWGYDGTFPGPTIEATADERVTVDWVNDLRDGQGAPRTDHYLPVDLCPHGPNMFGSTPRTVVHLHGAHTTEESDGYPEDTTLPGESNFYEYPNHQLPATLWYHDHALGITRLNVYMGLAGFYLIRDAFEQSLGLPDGEYEVPLVIQDRSFNVDGSFRYPEQWQETFFGDHNLVNGKVSPYLNVKQGKYRFRVLNGANSRTYTIALSGGVPLQVIGTDGGLLPAPVTMNEITLAPAERADIIIDFSALPPGTEVIMTNSASAPLVAPPGTNVTPDVMKFIVQGEAGFLGSIPATLRPITPHQEVDAVEHRDFELTRAPDPCTGFTWLINGLHWDDITEFPELGSTEVWNFINRSQMVHPMHMHLVMFQVLDRQQFQVVNDQVVPIGSPVPPAPHEAGWKDTVPVYPNEIVRVIAKFEDYTGKFAYHCHVIEHEDQEMMRQYQVVDSCGNGVLGPIEQCEVGDDTACPGLCQGDCTCASPPVCGNGVRETGEECDAADASTCSSGQCYGPGSSEGPECTCVPPSTDIPPGGGVVVGITSGASNLSGSCGSGSANAPEQALTWVPDFTGEVTLQTCSANTEFDTVLYVREGNLAATDIACADDTAGCGTSSGSPRQDRHGSRVTINVVAGLTYYVVVDGYRPSSGADEGAFELTVTPTGASLLPDLTATVSDLQIEFNTTVPAADLAEGCASAANGVDLLRFTGTTNNVGPGDLIAGDPGCPDCTQNPSAACTDPSFVCASAAGQGEFRNFASYELLDASGQNVVAQGYKRGFCLRDDVCSSGSPSYDCSFQGISAGCSDVYDSSLGCQYIEVTGLPAGDYMVRMTSDPLNLFQESNEANNVDLVPVTIPPASNIRPIAEPDSGTTDEDTPITVDVLFNDSDPDGLLEPSSVAVIVPASNGLTSVNPTNGMITYTPNPNYFGEDTFSYQVLDDLGGADAALVTITVNPINDPPTAADDSAYTLIEAQVTVDVLSNDSDPEGALDSTSVELISPPVNGGVFIDPLTGSIAYTPNPLFEGTDQLTYQVKDVEGLSDTALLTVQVTSLPSGVLPIPPGGGVIAGFTSGSSSYSGSCAGASANAPEQVFAWVPGVSGTAIIETCSLNTEFDTVLYARDGDIAGPELGCSDDVSGCAVSDGSIRSGRHGSRVTFDVVAGQTYYLFADAYSPSSGASEGNFELTVIPPGP
ncbi:MAG: lysyl oxidase family protein [Polyangiales bacterium]